MARTTKTVAASITASDCLRNADTTNVLHDLNTPEGRLAARAAGVPPAQLKATVVDEPSTPMSEAYAAFLEAQQKMMEAFGISSPARYVISMIVGALVSFGLGMLGGWVTLILALSALAFTGSMFLYYATWVVGVVLTVYLGSKAGGAAFDYIAFKKIDKHAEIISDYARGSWYTVKGWFTSSPKNEVAA